jgi:hypothetical protein
MVILVLLGILVAYFLGHAVGRARAVSAAVMIDANERLARIEGTLDELVSDFHERFSVDRESDYP